MVAIRSIVGTMKTDWKTQALFWSMVVCGVLIISAVVIAARMI